VLFEGIRYGINRAIFAAGVALELHWTCTAPLCFSATLMVLPV
jgi:hypothetical protein